MGAYDYRGPIVRLWGRNLAIHTTMENLSEVSNLQTFSSYGAAVKLQASSSSADDDGAPVGTGALTLRIIGLNSSYVLASEDIVLNGVTAVETVATFLRVFAAYVLTAGTGLTNAGDIYVYKTGAAITAGVPDALTTTWVKIPVGANGASSGMITVPLGKNYEVRGGRFSARTQSTDFYLYAHAPVGTETAIKLEDFFPAGTGTVSANTPERRDLTAMSPLRFPEKTDLYLRAISGTTGGVGQGELFLEEYFPAR